VAIGAKLRPATKEGPDLVERRTPDRADLVGSRTPVHGGQQPRRDLDDVYLLVHRTPGYTQ
jgi:hypothetical protein